MKFDFFNRQKVKDLQDANMRMFERNKQSVLELESKVFDLERELFETKEFERIGDEKLKMWINKYDDLLIKYKQNTMEETKITDAEVVADVKVAEDVKAEETVTPEVPVDNSAETPVIE